MPTLQRRRLLFQTSGITYLIRDEFLTAIGAPITTPRNAEPGPGVLTFQAGASQYSIASGKLTLTSGVVNNRFVADGLARVAGRAMVQHFKNNGVCQFGGCWYNTSSAVLANVEYGFQMYSAGASLNVLQNSTTGANAIVATTVDNTDYAICTVLRGTGAFFFIKGGTFTNWTLLWVHTLGTTSTLYPGNTVFGNTASVASEYLRVADLGGVFASDNGIAILNQANPVNGTLYGGIADGIFDLTITAPNPLANTGHLIYRRLDASNYWDAYYNAAGDFKVDSVVAGVATNRITGATVTVAGATTTIRAIAFGNKHDFYTLSAGAWTKRGSQVVLTTAQDAATDTAFTTDGTWTSSLLKVFPRNSGAFGVLDRV